MMNVELLDFIGVAKVCHPLHFKFMAEPIFTGRYSYRKTTVLIVGSLMFLATGSFLVVLASSAILKPPQGRDILAGLFAVGISGTLCFVGAYLLWAFIRRYQLVIEIDDGGVRHGKKNVPWERVRSVAATYYQGRYQLVVRRRGFSSDLHITTDEGLTEKEYKRFIARLTALLADSHPGVQVG